VEKCVLTVRDNELDVGDSDNMSSEVAEGAGRCGKAWGSHVDGMRTETEHRNRAYDKVMWMGCAQEQNT